MREYEQSDIGPRDAIKLSQVEFDYVFEKKTKRIDTT